MSESFVDQAAPVRDGEALDVEALRFYLTRHGLAGDEELQLSQFPRGFSNLTYLVTTGGRSFVLRRPPFGVGKGVAHDVVREARLLAALGAAYAKVPRILAICDDPAVIGAPFYLMERASGIILRDRLPAGLALDAPTMRRVSEAAVDTLAQIHAVDYAGAGLAALGNPVGYVARQVSGWARRFEAARTGDQPDVDRIVEWLRASPPADEAAALVHNDFKYDNLVLDPHDPARVIAVLDWEMATIGDPSLDLGTTLAYWVEANDPPLLRSLGLGVTALPGNLTREEVVARYEAATGRGVAQPVFCYAFGLFKVAVIAQQILARYVRGFTRDERFARLDLAVAALGEAAVRAVDRGRIGNR
ncbi:MAG: phosphotransferase family protein [Gemmatimonadaceae bacterium]|nr:phosphotransferase family protein [Gemmatimonadaceae bacterium]